ncbi:MAG: ABC transporter substrate-binding protein [Arhodomonas sp.]|nr:ABC transporter substrate-binding protein [Arhodomonas sp.]
MPGPITPTWPTPLAPTSPCSRLVTPWVWTCSSSPTSGASTSWPRPAAEAAGDGIVFPVGAAQWGADVPGMDTIEEISQMSGGGERALHYMRGVCSVYFMRDAMLMAAEDGDITGPRVKAALESMRSHVPEGMEGVCLPHTWTPENHRGTTEVMVYQNEWKGDGDFELNKLTTVDLPRRDDWLGW